MNFLVERTEAIVNDSQYLTHRLKHPVGYTEKETYQHRNLDTFQSKESISASVKMVSEIRSGPECVSKGT